MAPGHFATVETFPVWTCNKLLDGEDLSVVSTMPTAFATALYTLNDRANLRAKERVLIDSGASDIGIAAIQVAQSKGAEVFAIVEEGEDQAYLVKNYGVERDNVFISHDSFLPAVLAKTKGRGVDVVLNSMTGDLLHDSMRCCARFGRFVDIAKRDLTDTARLDLQALPRNATYTSFDISELFDATDRNLSGTWQRYVSLIRPGE